MEVEQYGYRHGQAIDLGPVMSVTQFRVTDKAETYLCVAWVLVFEGSVLVYNPTRDEAEWVPTHGIANDLSWVEEKSAVALANFVPHIPQETARIARLGTRHLMSWPDDSSSQEEEEEDGQEEEEGDEQGEEEEHEEQGDASSELPSGSKVKQSMRLNHIDDNDCGSGGPSWMRRNVSPSMTHIQTPMPQLVAAPLYVRPHRSWGC